MSKPLDGYVEVAQRVQAFFEAYPDGSFQGSYEVVTIGDQTLIVYRSSVYRTPDDQRPAVAYAAEPFPGKTPFTKDSELQNAETSAIGRAIAALGFEVHEGIASANEVRNRSNGSSQPSDKQLEFLRSLLSKRFGGDATAIGEWIKSETGKENTGQLNKSEASKLIEELKS